MTYIVLTKHQRAGASIATHEGYQIEDLCFIWSKRQYDFHFEWLLASRIRQRCSDSDIDEIRLPPDEGGQYPHIQIKMLWRPPDTIIAPKDSEGRHVTDSRHLRGRIGRLPLQDDLVTADAVAGTVISDPDEAAR